MAGETYRTCSRTAGDAVTGAWTDWSPALTVVSGTDPVLGAGGGGAGRYVQVDKFVTAEGVIWFGTSGTNAGSGIYQVSLPVVARQSTGGEGAGSGWLWDLSATKMTLCFLRVYGASTAVFYFKGTAAFQVTNNQPHTWDVGDYVQVALRYEAL